MDFPTIIVKCNGCDEHPHMPPVQVPPKPEHPAWVSDPVALKKVYDKVQAMWAKSKKPKAKRIAFEQDIIPFEKFETVEMVRCGMVIDRAFPEKREWAYYMACTMPVSNADASDFVMRIYPDTSVLTGVPWGVYKAGTPLLEAEDMPKVVGEKRAREE